MKGQRIGYIRVSTIEQNPDRQLEGIELDRKFIDYATGRVYSRIEFDNMLSYIRQGDHVFVHSIDRIARNLQNLRKIVTDLNEKDITINFVKENLIFSPNNEDPRSTLMLSMMGAFAEFELALIRERQKEGIEIAKAKGGYKCGRPRKLSDEKIKNILSDLSNGMHRTEVLTKYEISWPTLWKYLKDAKKEVKYIIPEKTNQISDTSIMVTRYAC